MPSLRTVFMGTTELSCASLRALQALPEVEVVAAVTQPDRPSGRELKLHVSAVKQLALHERLPVLQPERARDPAFLEQLRALRPDLIVVVAYGQILPQTILDLPRLGCLNVHASLLPKYRGAAPVQWAIITGEKETGVTIMKMDAGMDTGDILSQQPSLIHPEDTSETLHERLARLGAELLSLTIPDFVAGKIQPRPQSVEGVSYAPKITRQDGRIDWKLPALLIWNRVRGLQPWPGAFTHLPGQSQSVSEKSPPSPPSESARPRPQQRPEKSSPSPPREERDGERRPLSPTHSPFPADFQARSQAHLLKIWHTRVAHVSGQPGEVLQADKTGLVVGCGRDALEMLSVQREGGRRLDAQQFLAGHPLKPGQHLG